MADYYSILKNTISGMANNSQTTRTVVYSKARSAINRQLRGMEPAPSEEAISRQMQLLEAAIGKLDAEYQSADAPGGDGVINNPQPDLLPTPSPNSTQNSDSQRTLAGDAQPATSKAGNISAPTDQPPAEEMAHSAPSIDVADSSNAHGVSLDNSGAGGEIPPIVSHEDATIVDPQGMEYSETILAAEPDTFSRTHENYGSEPQKSGIFSIILPVIVTLGVVGGGVYALWINKDALLDAVVGDDKNPVVQNTSNSVENNDETDSVMTDNEAVAKKIRIINQENSPKKSTKLTTKGETVDVEPSTGEEASGQSSAAADISTEQHPDTSDAIAIGSDGEEIKVVEVGEDGNPKPVAGEVNSEQNNDGTQVTALDAKSTTPAVAQKAYLYEEGASGSNASRDNAAIIWSLEHEILDGDTPEAVIKGQLDVPGRNLAMHLVIKRNSDQSLPASHIIELQFKLPKDFSGGGIADVSRFVMKSSEQGRGEGLIAVPAKISDGNFLIALNNLEQALDTNNKLLLGSAWIDVPIGYTTGRRALVTLEKGVLGDKIFREAFADWAKR